ncbi:MAG: hypothetical protein MZV70_20100 [Desulfobacterales bacterium]|nr:hypothetical protein [Desulfobacterales bacterium]
MGDGADDPADSRLFSPVSDRAGSFCSENVRALVSTVAVLGGVLLVALPWTIRNYSHFGAFVPLTTHGGLALFNCYVLPPQGFGYNAGGLAGEEYSQLTDEVSRSRYLNRKTLEYVQQNPLAVAKLTVTQGAVPHLSV